MQLKNVPSHRSNFWDENDNLISQNKKMPEVFKKKCVPPVKIGTHWKDMVKENIEKNVYHIDKGLNKKTYLKKRIEDRKINHIHNPNRLTKMVQHHC